MKVLYLYTGDDDRSHFADLEIPMASGRSGLISEAIRASGLAFRETGAGDTQLWHNAPYRQFIAILRGAVEIECGDGSTRQLFAGDVILADDRWGEGHITRELESPRVSMMVPVDGDFDIERWGRLPVPPRAPGAS
jgi:hypothetical protein